MTVVERVAGVWFAALDASAAAAAGLTARAFVGRRLAATETGQREILIYRDAQGGGTPVARIDVAQGTATAPLARLLRRSHVVLDLDPRHFLFRVIDLPGRAGDFVEAIMRSQVDRLAPWRPDQVVFGWTRPAGAEDAAFTLAVAIANKASVLPLIERLQGFGASVVEARVTGAEGDGPPQVFAIAQASAPAYGATLWRRLLGGAAAAVVLLVIAASLFGEIGAMRLASETDEVDQLRQARTASLAAAAQARDPASAARRLVEQRRAGSPFATLVLEAVSRILPDDSFVTSFEIAGDRLRLVGFTADPPALIRLLGRSPLFDAVGFFAPTTRQASDPADRFSIEATIKPAAFVR